MAAQTQPLLPAVARAQRLDRFACSLPVGFAPGLALLLGHRCCGHGGLRSFGVPPAAGPIPERPARHGCRATVPGVGPAAAWAASTRDARYVRTDLRAGVGELQLGAGQTDDTRDGLR
jgi:hypothetical protein